MNRRRLKIGIVILLPVVFISWCTVRDNFLERNFPKIVPGMSPAQVTEIMGSPTWDGQCGYWGTGMPALCAHEFGYRAASAPLDPTYYLIWFDAKGLVTDTASIHSP